jgi:hypothetical protein
MSYSGDHPPGDILSQHSNLSNTNIGSISKHGKQDSGVGRRINFSGGAKIAGLPRSQNATDRRPHFIAGTKHA